MNQRHPEDRNAEVDINATELRGSVLVDRDIEYIAHQTSVHDHILIKRHLAENNNNIPLTILSLLNLKEDQTSIVSNRTENTVFDEIRKILNEKEIIYQDVMKSKNNT
jgi:hypothetical protein